MNEEIEFILDSTKESMEKALKHLEKQFINIRAGKASPSMLGSVNVDYYGTLTPLAQVANVNTPEYNQHYSAAQGLILFHPNFNWHEFYIPCSWFYGS